MCLKLVLLLMLLLATEHECIDVRAAYHKIVDPLKSVGDLGHDLIKESSKAIHYIKDEISALSNQVSYTFSKVTKGLDCNTTLNLEGLESFKIRIQAIFPGTKWCGDGSVSRSYNDLGTFSKTDSCCRSHDSCPGGIGAGQTKYNLENTGLFTRSSCDCDAAFYTCLKEADTHVARAIGFTYFSVLGPQCFKEEYPISGCGHEMRGRCLVYEFDHSVGMKYQWFDNPTYGSPL